MLESLRVKKYNNKTFPIASGDIFRLMLNIPEILNGQQVTVYSPFKEEKTPSCVIYYSNSGKDDYYRFNDFSSGKKGDAIDMFMDLYGSKFKVKDRQDAYYAILKIVKQSGKLDEIKRDASTSIEKEVKYVSRFKLQKWTKEHVAFAKSFGWTSQFVNEYYIRPISFYQITIKKGSVVNTKEFTPDLCFGFFKKDGTLYKLYNPENVIAKYIKVNDYTIGTEQLKPERPICLIMSGLKDIGSFYEMNMPSFNLVAPDSESVDLPLELIADLKRDHKYVFTLFDNDSLGLKKMLHYKETYFIPFIHFNIEKDFAQTRFDHGLENTKLFFYDAFKKAKKEADKFIDDLPY